MYSACVIKALNNYVLLQPPLCPSGSGFHRLYQIYVQ